MKHVWWILIVLSLMFSSAVFAAETTGAASPATPAVTAAPPATPQAAAPAPVKVPKMTASGKVVEITDTLLKMSRTIKGNVESMEFVLEKPVAKIAVGNQVKVSYVEKEGHNVALKVQKIEKIAKAPAKQPATK